MIESVARCHMKVHRTIPLSFLFTICRVALMYVGYHGAVQDEQSFAQLSGSSDLNRRLLEARDCKVLTVMYTDIKPKQKMLETVQMLQSKLKHGLQS